MAKVARQQACRARRPQIVPVVLKLVRITKGHDVVVDDVPQLARKLHQRKVSSISVPLQSLFPRQGSQSKDGVGDRGQRVEKFGKWAPGISRSDFDGSFGQAEQHNCFPLAFISLVLWVLTEVGFARELKVFAFFAVFVAQAVLERLERDVERLMVAMNVCDVLDGDDSLRGGEEDVGRAAHVGTWRRLSPGVEGRSYPRHS
ncbi:hypothetical protein BKA81DRAFT_366478 [Phyllosticta paracitricarpa]